MQPIKYIITFAKSNIKYFIKKLYLSLYKTAIIKHKKIYPIINPPLGDNIFCTPLVPPEKTGRPTTPKIIYIKTEKKDICISKTIAYIIIINVLIENGMIEIFIVKGESIQSILDRSEIITKFLVFNLNILYYKKITIFKKQF